MTPVGKPTKIAVIAGAGPAGLTAALELLRRSDIIPIIFEADSQVGGISKTINYRGNRMDLGGHRFFSKSDWVMRWWQDILPIAAEDVRSNDPVRINYQRQAHEFMPDAVASASSDAVMLVRQRLSRILYRGRFFDYPLTLNAATLGNLGAIEAARIGLSYGYAQLNPASPEISLRDFLVNRFGYRLYSTFFRDYTEKVWGVPCEGISAEWGAQRIKNLSVAKAIGHAFARPLRRTVGISQKLTETSLIDRFLYPKLGPGQMWEEVTRRLALKGSTVHLQHRIVGIERTESQVTAVDVFDEISQSVRRVPCDYLISTIPIRHLVRFLAPADQTIRRIAEELPYRDFMTVGLLLTRMENHGVRPDKGRGNGMPPDNWIYIQEPDVKLGRLQVFNNWSPALVADPDTIWLGLEYFCGEGDALWSAKDGDFVDFAAMELEKIGLIDRRNVIDGTVVRVPKAYPAYFGSYSEFDNVRLYLDRFKNLYPIGRNGMHRYNNQDHSMLAANRAVGSIVDAGAGKEGIWQVNADSDYHEEIASRDVSGAAV